MIYFANPTVGAVQHMMRRHIGWMAIPDGQSPVPRGVIWCADNGCFSDKFNEDRWWRFLQRYADERLTTCVFATAPDVVGDAEATLMRSAPWLPKLRRLRYPAAFVAQDGAERFPPPWGEFDALFIGGSTDFKLGPVARALVVEAKEQGLWVHMGRVNSRRRYRYAEAIGCDSVDGTFLVFGPTVNLPKLLTWVNQPSLFEEMS